MSLLVATLTLSLVPTAQAEWYIGAYGGLANPGALTNVTLSDATVAGGVNNARVFDLALDSSFVVGAKVGYFLAAHPWLGIETEVYTLRPDAKRQTIVGGTTSGRVFADTLPATPLWLTPWVVNIIIRSPAISETFYPYAGMGYGLFFSSSSTGGQSNLHVDSGLNLFVGARYVVRPKLALFGEYKFNSATIHFSGVRGNFTSQMFIFGVMWHFENPDK